MCGTIKREQVAFFMGELILEKGWVVVSWLVFVLKFGARQVWLLGGSAGQARVDG